MAKLKLYNKKGNLNKEEKKYIKALEKYFKENPEKAEDIVPAKSASGLKKMYEEYTVTDVDFEESEGADKNDQELDEFLKKQESEGQSSTQAGEMEEEEDTHESFRNKMEEDINVDVDTPEQNDPFNRDNPIIRDYAMGQNQTQQNIQSTSPSAQFGEPQSFRDSFEIPDGANEEKLSDTGKVETAQPVQEKREKYVAPQPLNPAYDDMANNKKRNSTKRFAKYIVEATCMLSEKGFVWFATKEITEAKIAEYELKDELDLSLMLTILDERNMEQQVTIKQFFKIQCNKAEFLSKIDKDEKQDLINALTEVLLEKGVGPTPTQELILISLKIFGGQAMTLFALTSQTNSVLNQLRAMKEGSSDQTDVQSSAGSEAVAEQLEQKIAYQETTEAIKAQTSGNKSRSRSRAGSGKTATRGKGKEGDFSLKADQDSKETKE